MRITLCGSALFEPLFHEINEKLSLSGHVVYGLSIYPSYKGGIKEWYTGEQKQMLDAIHLCKIDNSDGIVVINPNNYMGVSTTKEMKHANISHKKIFFHNGGPHWTTLLSDELRIAHENSKAAESTYD